MAVTLESRTHAPSPPGCPEGGKASSLQTQGALNTPQGLQLMEKANCRRSDTHVNAQSGVVAFPEAREEENIVRPFSV